MKLLRLKIESPEGFRSLPQDFEINFHSLDNIKAMGEFRPFCFAGLNGSGKSNVLEALSAIFYHLEFCVARYKPDSFKKHFDRKVCIPDAFTLEYLIGQHNRKQYSIDFFDKVTIIKNSGEAPRMFLQKPPFKENTEKLEVSLLPSENRQEAAEGKTYLPAHIIGYSSGENEILSLPFIKSRLVHLDEYKQATKDKARYYTEPENSLIYIDRSMSQAVLLACLLLESDETLAPIKDKENTGIVGLRSFRMNINLHQFKFQKNKENILHLIKDDQLEKLKKCATSWYTNEKILWLDFFVNDATKAAFKYHFQEGTFEVFQLFRLLYELNAHFIEENTIEEVYQSKGFYTDGKLPVGSPEQDVFHFLDFYITKKIKDTGKEVDLLLRNFSDGEHQFLHTMGICLLLKGRRAILLLDEPETHFNPSWRAKFVKILNDSIVASNKGDHPNGNFNIHLLKDILLTSHSPFIISDCLPDNVIFFNKVNDNKVNDNKVKALKASDIGLKTYGSDTNYILKNFFNTELISSKSLSELKSIIETGTIDELRKAVEDFGESSQKQFLFRKIYEKTNDRNDNKAK